MVCTHGLRDKSLGSEGERLSGASSSPFLLGLEGPLEEDPSMCLDLSTEDNLIRFGQLITEVIA